MGSKIGLGGPLGGSLGHLGPKSQTRPPRVRRWASKGLPGTPKLEAKLDPKRTKLGPNGAQVGDFVDLCLHLCNHAGPRARQNPIRGPLDPKMLPKCTQHARAESHEMRALLIRNTLFRFPCPSALGSLLTPYLGPIFHPSWPRVDAKRVQVGPKRDPRPLGKRSQNNPKPQCQKRCSKCMQRIAGNLGTSSWGPLRVFNTGV